MFTRDHSLKILVHKITDDWRMCIVHVGVLHVCGKIHGSENDKSDT